MLKKSVVAFFIVFLLIFTACIFSGCEEESIEVESIINIDSNFSGNRTVNIVFPLSVNIDSVLNDIKEKAPAVEGVSFEYQGVEKDGYHFQLIIVFNSRPDYATKVSSLIGREANVLLSHMDTILAKGTIMKEDFDNADLVYWIPRITKNNSQMSSLSYKYNGNTVSIGGEIYTTKSKVNIIERTGAEINGIVIDTTNSKDETYDRTITFSIPDDTYKKIENKLKTYFEDRTMPTASYYGWADKGETKEYTVIYENLSIEDLGEYTGKLLDTEDEEVFYGDKDNSSTPLSEGLIFEENFNTFSFIGNKSRPINITYNYALPVVSTHGEGAVKVDGSWKQSGSWESGVYSVDLTDDVVSVRIPDGIQYDVKEINFSLNSVSENNFIRTTEFIYSGENADAFDYAYKYFTGKDAKVETQETDDGYICRVISSGSSGEISDELASLFGSGNYLSYSRMSKRLSLSDKTHLIDNINMGHMLNEQNKNIPMTYSVGTMGEERIFTLECDGKQVGNGITGEEVLSVNVECGQAMIEYRGNIPKIGIVITFITVFAAVLMSAVLIIVLMNVGRRIRKKKVFIGGNYGVDEDPSGKGSYADDDFADAPFQTTMFKISELMKFKEKSEKGNNGSAIDQTQNSVQENEQKAEETKETAVDKKEDKSEGKSISVSEELDESINILKVSEEKNDSIKDTDKIKIDKEVEILLQAYDDQKDDKENKSEEKSE